MSSIPGRRSRSTGFAGAKTRWQRSVFRRSTSHTQRSEGSRATWGSLEGPSLPNAETRGRRASSELAIRRVRSAKIADSPRRRGDGWPRASARLVPPASAWIARGAGLGCPARTHAGLAFAARRIWIERRLPVGSAGIHSCDRLQLPEGVAHSGGLLDVQVLCRGAHLQAHLMQSLLPV